MRILLTVLAGLGLALAAPAPPPQALSASQKAMVAKAGKVEPESCGPVESFQDCHADYAAGCSDSERPSYDAYLNYVKNQLPDPALSPVKVLDESDMAALDAALPPTLHRGNHALEFGDGTAHAYMDVAVQTTGAAPRLYVSYTASSFLSAIARNTSNASPGTGIQTGDSVVLTFANSTNAYAVTPANIGATLGLGGHSWGTISSARWTTTSHANDTLTITLTTGGPPTVVSVIPVM